MPLFLALLDRLFLATASSSSDPPLHSSGINPVACESKFHGSLRQRASAYLLTPSAHPYSRQSPEQKCLLYLLYNLFLTDFTRVGSNYTLLSTHQLRALESPFEERGRSTDTEREGSGESCHRRCLLSSSSSFFAIPSSPSLHRIPPLLLFQPPHLNQPMNQTNPLLAHSLHRISPSQRGREEKGRRQFWFG